MSILTPNNTKLNTDNLLYADQLQQQMMDQTANTMNNFQQLNKEYHDRQGIPMNMPQYNMNMPISPLTPMGPITPMNMNMNQMNQMNPGPMAMDQMNMNQMNMNQMNMNQMNQMNQMDHMNQMNMMGQQQQHHQRQQHRGPHSHQSQSRHGHGSHTGSSHGGGRRGVNRSHHGGSMSGGSSLNNTINNLDNTNLYIKGLWKDCSQVELDDLFKQFGVISQSRVYGDGVGFVRFEMNDQAERVCTNACKYIHWNSVA